MSPGGGVLCDDGNINFVLIGVNFHYRMSGIMEREIPPLVQIDASIAASFILLRIALTIIFPSQFLFYESSLFCNNYRLPPTKHYSPAGVLSGDYRPSKASTAVFRGPYPLVLSSVNGVTTEMGSFDGAPMIRVNCLTAYVCGVVASGMTQEHRIQGYSMRKV